MLDAYERDKVEFDFLLLVVPDSLSEAELFFHQLILIASLKISLVNHILFTFVYLFPHLIMNPTENEQSLVLNRTLYSYW